MRKPKRPLKPFKGAMWNEDMKRWVGIPPSKNHDNWFKSFEKMIAARKARAAKDTKISGRFGDIYYRKISGSDKIPKPKRKKLPMKSEAQKKEDSLYAVLKKEWAKTHRYCVPCRDVGKFTKAEPYPHHIRGRGRLLNDVRFWLPICVGCHHKIENDRAWARRMGYLASRDAKTIALQCGNK
jgi:hypothetical protein